jgi:RTX calcium-binding nonapeptide repeat (4 copies)
MADIVGRAGNDFIHVMDDGRTPPNGYRDDPAATTGDDTIDLAKGGNDTVFAGGGNDTILMLGAFTAADHLNGEGGSDVLELEGDYASGVVFQNNTISGIERIRLKEGHDYNLTLADGNVAAGATLNIDASRPARPLNSRCAQ